MKKSKEMLALSTLVALSTASPAISSLSELVSDDLNENHSRTRDRPYSQPEKESSNSPHTHFLSQYHLNFEKELERRSSTDVADIGSSSLSPVLTDTTEENTKIPFGLRYLERSNNTEEDGPTITWKDLDFNHEWSNQ